MGHTLVVEDTFGRGEAFATQASAIEVPAIPGFSGWATRSASESLPS